MPTPLTQPSLAAPAPATVMAAAIHHGAMSGGSSTAAATTSAKPMMALTSPATGYSFVYHIEMYLMFATLVALGPLVGRARTAPASQPTRFGLAEFPG